MQSAETMVHSLAPLSSLLLIPPFSYLRHARTYLPKYAVPIFIRRIAARSATHNNKQDKVPLKRAGVDPEQTKPDPVFWVADYAKGNTYIPFTQRDWDSLKGGHAKL